ncbi:hypothetical protein ACHQM5_013918 [Ranunculus cassubicifolius]
MFVQTNMSRILIGIKIKISASSSSKGSRGFGSADSAKKQKPPNKLKIPKSPTSQAPGLNSQLVVDGKFSNIASDLQFEERLQAIRRSALEQKKVEESTQYGPIDYDAPVVLENKQVGIGTKLGVGIAVVVFGLVFALGDFLPTTSSNDGDTVVENKLTEEEKVSLKSRLEQYEKQLSLSPEDPVSLEAAAVTLSELGQYDRAASLLEKLSKEKPSDPDVYRLLGEVKYELKDYEGSVSAYKRSASVSETSNFEVLRGLTNSLLAAKKPDEAVQVLLTTRERLNTAKSQADVTGKSQVKMQDDIDPIQVDLLLGKAYSDWGHVGDAVTVYDQLISAHPEDFRGYLAKGIILKENGKTGDAERMFIQARFFAPYKAKTLVDRYSKQ